MSSIDALKMAMELSKKVKEQTLNMVSQQIALVQEEVRLHQEKLEKTARITPMRPVIKKVTAAVKRDYSTQKVVTDGEQGQRPLRGNDETSSEKTHLHTGTRNELKI